MSGEYWPQFYEAGSPKTMVVIEEAPLAHPPGFVQFSDPPRPQVNPNCRIKKVTFK